MADRNNPGSGSPKNAFWGLIVILLGLLGLYFIARVVFSLLYYLAPILFIASLIIDHKVFLEYVGWIRNLFRKDTWLGIAAVVLSLVGYPIVAALLLVRALNRKQGNKLLQDLQRRSGGELTDFEELDSRPLLPKQPLKQENRNDPDDYVPNP